MNGHPAPLEQLPIFVRAGAVVPQGITARNASLVPEDSPITLSVYPQGDSEFSLYEDDKVTRGYADGESSAQEFIVTAPDAGKKGTVTVAIGERDGEYAGKAAARPYVIEAHTGSEPKNVAVDDATLRKLGSLDELEAASSGWFYDADDAGGIVTVKLEPIASGDRAEVVLAATSSVGGLDQDAAAASVAVDLVDRVFQGEQTTVSATFRNTGTKAKDDVVLTAVAPEGWTLVSASGDHVGTVNAGDSANAEFVFEVTDASAADLQTVTVEAAYISKGDPNTVSGANQLYVAYGSLASRRQRRRRSPHRHRRSPRRWRRSRSARVCCRWPASA